MSRSAASGRHAAGAHDHGHGDAHGHAHAPRGQRELLLVLLLSACTMVAELVGGLLTNSLALLADSGHMLSDVAALALSLFAAWIAARPPSARRTYGYYRAEILAALLNGALLVALAILIMVEAYRRLSQPPVVAGMPMMAVASGGLLVNALGLWILRAGRARSLNLHGAWLHVMSDALGSVGAVVAGFLVWRFGWTAADPLTSALIALLIVWSSLTLLRQSVNVLMEGTPHGIDLARVRRAMAGVRGVDAVHDLHVWSITTGMDALSAHVVATDPAGQKELLAELRATLEQGFGISHVTIQIEHAPCGGATHH